MRLEKVDAGCAIAPFVQVGCYDLVAVRFENLGDVAFSASWLPNRAVKCLNREKGAGGLRRRRVEVGGHMAVNLLGVRDASGNVLVAVACRYETMRRCGAAPAWIAKLQDEWRGCTSFGRTIPCDAGCLVGKAGAGLG